MAQEMFVDFIKPRIMSVPIESYGNNAMRGSSRSGSAHVVPDALEWNFTKSPSEADIIVFEASIRGTSLGTLTLRGLKDDKLYLRILLPNAIISSYQTQAESVSFTLNCDKPVYFVTRT